MGRYKQQVKNANKHTEPGTRLLDESVKRDGWIGATTHAANGETFDGSNRLKVGGEAFEDAIEVHTDGTRPVVVIRDDIPTADDPKAKRLGVVANHVTAIDWEPNAAILAEIANDDPIVKAMAQDNAKLRELLEGDSKPNSEIGNASPQMSGLEYRIIVDCASELHQRELMERFEVEGLTCRALIS